MNLEMLTNAISKYVPLSESEKTLISNYFTFKDISSHFKIIDYGEKTDEWYFLKKGCVRFYYIKENGEEVTGFFFTENMFFTSLESFLTNEPSTQVFETLEPTELFAINKDDVESLCEELPKMNIFLRKLLEERFINAQKVLASFILLKPEERYYKMFERQPEILNRVPQHTLATYLGITPVSLSRIRKRLSQ